MWPNSPERGTGQCGAVLTARPLPPRLEETNLTSSVAQIASTGRAAKAHRPNPKPADAGLAAPSRDINRPISCRLDRADSQLLPEPGPATPWTIHSLYLSMPGTIGRQEETVYRELGFICFQDLEKTPRGTFLHTFLHRVFQDAAGEMQPLTEVASELHAVLTACPGLAARSVHRVDLRCLHSTSDPAGMMEAISNLRLPHSRPFRPTHFVGGYFASSSVSAEEQEHLKEVPPTGPRRVIVDYYRPSEVPRESAKTAPHDQVALEVEFWYKHLRQSLGQVTPLLGGVMVCLPRLVDSANRRLKPAFSKRGHGIMGKPKAPALLMTPPADEAGWAAVAREAARPLRFNWELRRTDGHFAVRLAMVDGKPRQLLAWELAEHQASLLS
jgi:hypothetical protein